MEIEPHLTERFERTLFFLFAEENVSRTADEFASREVRVAVREGTDDRIESRFHLSASPNRFGVRSEKRIQFVQNAGRIGFFGDFLKPNRQIQSKEVREDRVDFDGVRRRKGRNVDGGDLLGNRGFGTGNGKRVHVRNGY